MKANCISFIALICLVCISCSNRDPTKKISEQKERMDRKEEYETREKFTGKTISCSSDTDNFNEGCSGEELREIFRKNSAFEYDPERFIPEE